MTPQRTLRCGFFTVEVLASLMLVIFILMVFAYGLTQFSHLSDVLMTRQRAALAAEAVLNEIRSGYEPTNAQLAARFRDLSFEIQQTAGTGEWDDLTRVTVMVRGTAACGRPVRFALDGYIRKVLP